MRLVNRPDEFARSTGCRGVQAIDRWIDGLADGPVSNPPPQTNGTTPMTQRPPTGPQIRFLLLQNRQGKTRLSKWYVPPPNELEKFRMEAEIHKLIVSRDRKYTNFVEVRSCVCFGGTGPSRDSLPFLPVSSLSPPKPSRPHLTPRSDPIRWTAPPRPTPPAVPELQAHLPALRGAVLLHGRGRDGQRAGVPRVDPPLRGAPRRVLPQRLRARHRLQFQQGPSAVRERATD